jgi:hypothetical protein
MKLEIINWLHDNKDKFDPHVFCMLQNQIGIFFYLFDSLQKKDVKDVKKRLEMEEKKGI